MRAHERRPIEDGRPILGDAKPGRARLPAPERLALAIVALATALCALAMPVTLADLKVLDLQFSVVPRKPSAAPIAVIGIDERSVRSIRDPVALWHRTFATVLHAMRDGGARALGFDVSLPERSFAHIVPGLDEALIGGLLESRRAFPTVLALTVDASGAPRPLNPAIVAAANTTPGFALWPVDADGTVRRYDERLGEGGREVPMFVGSLARAVGIRPQPGYIDFSIGTPFESVALADVLEHEKSNDSAWLRARFEDRIVLLGSTLPFEDVVRTPLRLAASGAPAAQTPGVFLHAQALRSFAAAAGIQPLAAWALALLATGTCALPLVARSLKRGWLMLAATVALIAVASTAALARGILFPVAWPMFGTIMAFTAWHGVEVAMSLRERRRLRESFGRYVSPAVLDNILAGRIRPEFGGSQRYVCALFSDMRNYTPRSERMTPAQNIAFLNRYFERVVAILHEAGGTVMSFAGDGIMAVFGAPQDLPNPCEAAFGAARRMLDFLPSFNAELAHEGAEPLEIGIGLHAGTVIVGHVGATARHDYTAIGDAINVASRLEGCSKEVGFRLVCSREVANRLVAQPALAPLGRVQIKGHSAVDAYGYSPVSQGRSGRPAQTASQHVPENEVSEHGPAD